MTNPVTDLGIKPENWHKIVTVRMIRPPWDEVRLQTTGLCWPCGCGIILQTVEQVQDHWQRGHFDVIAPSEKPKPERVPEDFTCPRCLKAGGLHSIHPWNQADDALAANGKAGRMICTACANHLRLGEPDPKPADRADWKRFDEAELG